MKPEDLTPYQQHQLETYGNILDQPEINPDGECESGEEEMNRFAEWNNEMAERELFEYD